jgi:hypothetical protein
VTTKRLKQLVLALLILWTGACVTDGVGKRGGLKQEVIDTYPPKVAESYDVFQHKCSRCHALARPLNAPIYDAEHWEAYVARMRRQPGSGISESDGETILVFLKYYAAQKKRDRALQESGDDLTGSSSVAVGGSR